MGIRIDTAVEDNVAKRGDGCLEIIDGVPWRINLLDTVTTEVAVPWTETRAINPGPFQFHPDESHVRSWMAERAYLSGRGAKRMRGVDVAPQCADHGCARSDSLASPASASRWNNRVQRQHAERPGDQLVGLIRPIAVQPPTSDYPSGCRTNA